MTWPHGRARHGGFDRIPLPIRTGGLWLCGKHFVGPDAEAALTTVGATTVVCLCQRSELASRYPDYVAWLEREAPARALWHPVHDFHAPSPDAGAVLLEDLTGRLRTGEGLLVHCGAGMGRAGTVGAAILITLGMSLGDALATVAAFRSGAGPERGVQREFLEGLVRPIAG